MARAQVLVVDDRESVLELVASVLGDAYEVTTVADPGVAISLLEERCWAAVLTDVRMPGATGFDVLAAATRSASRPSVVMMTGFASIPDAVRAIRQGAFDYVAKPLEADDLALVVARAVEHQRAEGAGAAGEVATDFHAAIVAARERASRDYLVALMRQLNGNVTLAARHAGVTRESLHRLLRKYGVHSAEFKASAP
jgi:DNA-binding NtrC family response regulator